MIVMKFGGTSVGDVAALRQVCRIVDAARAQSASGQDGIVVVTSAMKGVTNALLAAATAAVQGDMAPSEDCYALLARQHREALTALVPAAAAQAALEDALARAIRHLKRLLESIAVLGEMTPKGQDWIAGAGETIMGPFLTAILNAAGLPATHVDARRLIVTDAVFGGAEPLVETTEKQCRDLLLPLLRAGQVAVTSGYVGATGDGVPTTLGRGGSDYSAAIIGAALDADDILIYTDVSGVKTADPRIVPNARSLREISYSEIAELAYYGAQVLHPKTVRPAIRKGIALRVLNTFEPEHPGTRVVLDQNLAARGNIRAVTAIRRMNLIRIAGRGMIGVPGIAARAFKAVSDVKANVLMISQSSSEQSICFVVPEASAPTVVEVLRQEFALELARGYIDRIEGQPDIVIIAAVGHAIHNTPGIAAKVFTALAAERINVISIAQGASDAMISLVVAESEADQGVRALHAAFALHRPG